MLIRFASLIFLMSALGLSGCASNKPAILDAGLVDENGQPIAAPLPEGFEDKYRNGLSLLEDGDVEQAVEHWQGLTQSHAEFPGVWTNYGLSLFKQGNMKGALNAYENAQAVDPAYCPVNSLKGIVLRDFGRFDDAQLSYEAAITCAPKNGQNYYNLGILHDLYQNDLVSALHNYRKARRLMPDEKVLNIWVIDLARRSGEPEDDPAEIAEWEASLNTVTAEVMANSAVGDEQAQSSPAETAPELSSEQPEVDTFEETAELPAETDSTPEGVEEVAPTDITVDVSNSTEERVSE